MDATEPTDVALGHAAWVARCVGRADTSPLADPDLRALGRYLADRVAPRGEVLFRERTPPPGVWIIRSGRVEVSVGTGRDRAVVHLLRPGDVEGDIPLMLDAPLPYTGRALEDTECLFLDASSFERLIVEHPAIAHRWLSSLAIRMARVQQRVFELLGRSLAQQLARLLLDEAEEGEVVLAQRTLAAMLGVQRQSVNRTLNSLAEEGLVSLGYAHVRLNDEKRLQALASGSGDRRTGEGDAG